MDRLAFNAAAAINEMRTARQMTTNELANVATPGFKRSFESAMLTMKVQGAGFESRLQPQAFASDNINMKPGVIVKTGRDLDVAMDEQTVMGVTATEGALVIGALAFMPTHLHQQYGLSVVAAGSVMMLYGVGGLLYSQMARRWLAWLGERGLVRTGAALVGIGLLVLAWGSGVWVGMLACLMAGLGFYMLHNTLQVQATQMAPAARGTAVTLFACSLFFGQSIGVLLMAQSVDIGWLANAFTGVAAGVGVLGAVIYRLVGRH